MDNAATRRLYMINAVLNTQTEDMRALAERVLHPLVGLGSNGYCLPCLVLMTSFAPGAHRWGKTVELVTCALSGTGSTRRSQKFRRHQRQDCHPSGRQWPNPAGRWPHGSPRGNPEDPVQNAPMLVWQVPTSRSSIDRNRFKDRRGFISWVATPRSNADLGPEVRFTLGPFPNG